MKPTRKHYQKILTGSALVLAITSSVFAQEKPFSQAGTGQPPAPPAPPKKAAAATSASASTATPTPAAATPEPNVLDKLFNERIPDVLAKGKVNVNVRLRYEQVDQSNLPDDSYAPTIRTRIGYTTASLYGFKAMVEGVNVSSIGPEHNYNAAGSNGQGSRPVVADPTLTELDQAWLAYSYTNLFTTKFGQQVINLDNQRFVGNVGWRQNMQTFDSVTAGSEPLKDLNLSYGYIWQVHRVFGDVNGLPAANRDFDSRSHLINLSYSGWKYGRFVGYAYLLDLSNAAGNNNSCATYGGYFAGAAPVNDKVSVDYRAEYAYQTDYADSALDYEASYVNAEAGVNVKPFAFGAGYELLGSGKNSGVAGGRAGFRTPLATLHAFDGWADVFLATPNNGLQDIYAYAQLTLPYQVPVRFVYHKFDADNGGGNYGQEFDVVATKKLGKYWSAMLKYAYYMGEDAAAPALAAPNVDVQKFWAQVEFNF